MCSSDLHALLSLRSGIWQIEDVGAQNGVLVNGERISAPCVLHRNDVITVGKRKLTVVRGSGRVGA